MSLWHSLNLLFQDYEEIGGLMFEKNKDAKEEKKEGMVVQEERIVDGKVVTYHVQYV